MSERLFSDIFLFWLFLEKYNLFSGIYLHMFLLINNFFNLFFFFKVQSQINLFLEKCLPIL